MEHFLKNHKNIKYIYDELKGIRILGIEGTGLELLVEAFREYTKKIIKSLFPEGLIVYLDDVRIPDDPNIILVKNYEEFINACEFISFDNIKFISLDHDLGESAMREWYRTEGKELDYHNIHEKTGYDAAKWIIDKWLEGSVNIPVYCHSANIIGSKNIISIINNYKHLVDLDGDSKQIHIPFHISY